MSNGNISLGEFERRHNVNKGTVSKRARELGYDTAHGLSPEAYQVMQAEFQVDQVQPKTETPPPHQPQTYRAGKLLSVRTQTVTHTVGLFDAESYEQDKQALETNARHQAASLNDMVAAYAQSRIAAVLADIDLVADGVRANALQAMGAQPGKPQDAATDGTAA
jgi:hypothetical protein